MYKLFFFLIALSSFALSTHATEKDSTIIELGPRASMSIAGKGPGQDAAINPFLGQACIAHVSNIGRNAFFIRVQNSGEIIRNTALKKGDDIEITLGATDELYFDSDAKAKAKVVFKKKN